MLLSGAVGGKFQEYQSRVSISDAMQARLDDRLLCRLPLKTAESVFYEGCQACLLHRPTAASAKCAGM